MELPTLQQVDEYPLPELLVPRVAKENNVDMETASAWVREAKRMLYLYAVSRQPVSPSKIVDEGWHAMLLFTIFYKDFAKFIGIFVHHNPTPGPPDGGNLYEATKQRYKEYLKVDPDPKYWP